MMVMDGECGYVLPLRFHDSSLSVSSKDALLSTECPSQTEAGCGHHTTDPDNTLTTLSERDRHSKWRCSSTRTTDQLWKKLQMPRTNRTEVNRQHIVRPLMNNRARVSSRVCCHPPLTREQFL